MSDTLDRLAFTTLGIPGVPLPEVAALGRDSGWRGVELRSADDEPVHVGLDAVERATRRDELGGMTLLATNSYVRAAGLAHSDAEIADAIAAEAQLAADLGARAVRVFPGGPTDDPAAHEAAEFAMIDRLRRAADLLPDGVELWLETHDSHRTGAAVARVLASVGSPKVRAIWDVAHPPKDGESWPRTLEALYPFLAHVQIKDERPGQVPLFLGEGEVPLAEIVAGLEREGYRGWYSYEYERKWHPEAPPLAEALAHGTRWWRAQNF